MNGRDSSTKRYSAGTAIVAGGSGGIGAAICRKMAEAGSNVALTYFRSQAKAEVLAEEIMALGRKALIVQTDLADADSTLSFIKQANDHFGGIHTAIYAAGPMLNMTHISKLPPDEFKAHTEVDLFGCYNVLQQSIPYLRESKGSVVALGTPAVRRFAVKDLLSACPKAAIESIIRAIAAEEGRFGIRANQVGVGVITDGMYDGLKEQGDFTDEWVELARKILALKRFGTAVNVAEAVEFLASDRAEFITGQTLMVDGGYAL